MTQKVEYYSNNTAFNLAAIIRNELLNGWLVKTMIPYENSVIVVYQKHKP